MSVEQMIMIFNDMRKIYIEELQERVKDWNLSFNEMNVLLFLYNNPHMDTHGVLSVVLCVSKALISRSLDGLHKKGLIYLQQDEIDHRIQHIKLSEQAMPLIEILTKEIKEINGRLFDSIEEAEWMQMEQTLTKMKRCLEERRGF